MNLYTLHKNNFHKISDDLNNLLLNKRLLISELSRYDYHIETYYGEMKSKVFINTNETSITIPLGLGFTLPIYSSGKSEQATTIDIFGDIATITRFVPHWGDIHTDVAYFPHYLSITAFRSLDES